MCIRDSSDGFWSDNANTRYPVLELEHNNVDSTFSSIWLNEAPLVATPEIAEIGASLYPNPAQDRLVIDVENVDISELELYDLTGELVEARAITPGKNEINVTNYQNGTYVYLLRLNNGDIGHSSRLIINR